MKFQAQRWFVVGALVAVGCSVADAQPRPRPAVVDAGVSRSNVVSLIPGQPVRAVNGARCVANVGCAAPRVLPVCVGSPQTLSLTDAWDQRLTLRGRSVTVVGSLRAAGGCTEMACGDTNACCNHCRGAIDLVASGQVRGARTSLAIGVNDDPAYVCTGDDSGLCCGTEVPGGDVRVTGTLELVEGGGGRYRVASPVVCRVR